jgi:hypothetical protein
MLWPLFIPMITKFSEIQNNCNKFFFDSDDHSSPKAWRIRIRMGIFGDRLVICFQWTMYKTGRRDQSKAAWLNQFQRKPGLSVAVADTRDMEVVASSASAQGWAEAAGGQGWAEAAGGQGWAEAAGGQGWAEAADLEGPGGGGGISWLIHPWQCRPPASPWHTWHSCSPYR